MEKALKTAVVLIAFSMMTFADSRPAYVHGGGLNSEGCHNNRRTGGYHCHRSYSSSSSRGRKPKMDITTIPKAQVWVDGKYRGVSPVKNIKFSRGTTSAKLLLRHPVLGSHSQTIEVDSGTDLNIRW